MTYEGVPVALSPGKLVERAVRDRPGARRAFEQDIAPGGVDLGWSEGFDTAEVISHLRREKDGVGHGGQRHRDDQPELCEHFEKVKETRMWMEICRGQSVGEEKGEEEDMDRARLRGALSHHRRVTASFCT